MTMLVVNARMYAVTPAVRDQWRALFDWIGRDCGLALTYVEHAAPAPLEELWSRGDLAAAFMCGYPFAMASPQPQLVVAPIPSPPRYGRRALYCTDFVVRADSKIGRLSAAFGGSIGWTVEHSQSGFNAVRYHLLSYRSSPLHTPSTLPSPASEGVSGRGQAGDGSEKQLFSASVGPLVTPRRVIQALLQDEIDVGPLDSYVHDLLRLHEPETAARLRTVESTAMTPMPPLIASPATAPETVETLRRALLGVATRPPLAMILADLLLAGFMRVDAADYNCLLDQARDAVASRYSVPS
jgi:ABC-type phosphate/phosphonate transport system substrate-binding protein